MKQGLGDRLVALFAAGSSIHAQNETDEVAIPVNRILNGEIGDPAMNVMRVFSLAVLCLAVGFGQARQEEKPVEQKPAKPGSGAKPEGIKVHGHWIIDIRNPDGSLATHREFENSLQPTGGPALLSSLARLDVTGLWQVNLQGNVCTGNFCNLYESNEPVSGPSAFLTLTVGLGVAGPNNGMLVLNGSFTAPQSGIISGVFTAFDFCTQGVLPANCTAQNGTRVVFTGVTTSAIPATFSAVSVTGGQFVQVTVLISLT
jgi:hypothetical protein